MRACLLQSLLGGLRVGHRDALNAVQLSLVLDEVHARLRALAADLGIAVVVAKRDVDEGVEKMTEAVGPIPATHAILTKLKARECIRHSI